MTSYIVYKHTAPNGKCYIGMTKQSAKKRWQNGLGYRTQIRFYRAIEKYGWDNFAHEVLYTGLSFEEAEQRECELIALYNSSDKNFGYNITNGGNGSKEITEENREKMRQSHKTESYLAWLKEKNDKRWSDPEEHRKMSERFKGTRNPMYGKKLSDEHKNKLHTASKAVPHRVLKGEENPMYGKHHSSEAKAKIGVANTGDKNGKARRVLCVETGAIYGSVRDACRETGVRFDSISRACRGVTCRAGGLHWRYADEEVT